MTIFFRLLEPKDKGVALQEAIAQLTTGTPNANTFPVEPASFQQVPGATFAYWVSERIRQVFIKLPLFESEEREIRVGDHPGDGFRYLRLFFEIPLEDSTQNWYTYQKGGAYSPFYSDIHLVADWDASRQSYRGFFGRPGRSTERPSNYQYFFRAGLTYPRRTNGLSIRVMPQGCIFADKGPAIFVKDDKTDELMALCAVVNSCAFNTFVSVQLARTELAQSFEVGLIQQTPVPDLTPKSTATLATFARRSWSLKRRLDTVTQTSHAFVLPALLQVGGSSLSQRATIWTEKVTATEAELAQIQTQIDALVFDLYGIAESDRPAINSEPRCSADTAGVAVAESEPDEEEERAIAADLSTLTRELLAYVLSVAIGRFDVRLTTGDRELPAEPEPFDPLPVCSPGMLVDENRLPPTEARSLPANYAIAIPFNGILVDDEGNPSDIISHFRDVLRIIWGDRDSDIEQEICQILKLNSLRDYFRKPAFFFNDHLSRYSKSRRQAPIYLSLSTRSGSYTLWLYYHRLTDQTLYTCINDYVEPKLGRISETVNSLRGKTGRSRDEEKTLEDLQNLEAELTELRDELLRVAKLPWKPNLNDGVQITVAPLHSLFRLGKWQKKLKETWDKLAKGDYDWAHLAHSIWTERVRAKCRTDKSLAIAHNLEDLYEPPPETLKRAKRKKKE